MFDLVGYAVVIIAAGGLAILGSFMAPIFGEWIAFHRAKSRDEVDALRRQYAINEVRTIGECALPFEERPTDPMVPIGEIQAFPASPEVPLAAESSGKPFDTILAPAEEKVSIHLYAQAGQVELCIVSKTGERVVTTSIFLPPLKAKVLFLGLEEAISEAEALALEVN